LIYLDSNVFISAALYDDEVGDNAREILRRVRTGVEDAATSALTFDEVCWIVRKVKGRGPALRIGKAILRMRNLEIIDVDREILWASYGYLEKEVLDPRDSIHLACAQKSGANIMVSEDTDFDGIDEMENIDMKGYLEIS